MFNDVTSLTLTSALHGLAARQRVISDNVANLQTPGFRAGKVQFEAALRDAVRTTGKPGYGVVSTGRSLEPTRLDGNNVNLDHESLQHIDTNLRYQLALRAVDHNFSLLRTSMRSQG